tara:strand:+ start:736 stop:924 length:189 start_codon:yes stop_codon:yes gene_type:complete
MNKTINGLTYKQWYAKVDAIVMNIAGVGIDDLSDGMSVDAWSDELTPKEYATDQLENEGFPF